MICLKGHQHHIEQLQGENAILRQANWRIESELNRMNALLKEERDERRKLVDRILRLNGLEPINEEPAIARPPSDSEPFTGLSNDIQSFVRQAELEESRAYAAYLHKEAQDMMRNPIEIEDPTNV